MLWVGFAVGGGRRCGHESGCMKWAQRHGLCMIHSEGSRKGLQTASTGQKQRRRKPYAKCRATVSSRSESTKSNPENDREENHENDIDEHDDDDEEEEEEEDDHAMEDAK
jgi:hypothetical protein